MGTMILIIIEKAYIMTEDNTSEDRVVSNYCHIPSNVFSLQKSFLTLNLSYSKDVALFETMIIQF